MPGPQAAPAGLAVPPAYGTAAAGTGAIIGPVRSNPATVVVLAGHPAVRPHRVAVVAATEPAGQAAEVLSALGSLRHGRW